MPMACGGIKIKITQDQEKILLAGSDFAKTTFNRYWETTNYKVVAYKLVLAPWGRRGGCRYIVNNTVYILQISARNVNNFKIPRNFLCKTTSTIEL